MTLSTKVKNVCVIRKLNLFFDATKSSQSFQDDNKFLFLVEK